MKLIGTFTVTPSDGGAGGTFTPASVNLTAASPSATVKYTPGSYGAKTLGVTNNRGLIDPAGVGYTATVTTYTLGGPGSGTNGLPSTSFTAALPVGGTVVGTVTVTPSDGGGGGTFTPTTVGLTTAAPSATFTYTAGSVGTKTVSVTNNGGLTNPGNLSYVAASSGLSDGASVSSWTDSSSAGRNATQTGTARPIFKVNIVNAKPAVLFDSALSQYMTYTSISGSGTWTVFAVMKPSSPTDAMISLGTATAAHGPYLGLSTGSLIIAATPAFGNASFTSGGTGWNSAFHVFDLLSDGSFYGDGTSQAQTSGAGITIDNFTQLGASGTLFSKGYIAEIVCYNSVLGGTDRANIEKYLGVKYGITVAGGSAVDPSTVSGLIGWWKADIL